MKRIIITVSIFAFIIFRAGSLEITEGKIKLDINRSNGRFSLYYLDDVIKKSYVPLLFDKDPETTSLFVSMDNKIYTMGDSSSFSQELVKNNDSSASLIWTSKQIRVTETFSLIKSLKSAFLDGMKISIIIENLSENPKQIGLSYLFDTYLGESSKVHFKTDTGLSISTETGYSSSFPNYFVSPSEKKSFSGLQCMLKGPGITLPDKVIFANWKRLKDNLWNFNVQNSRNFNLLPYSINDSAAALYYNQVSINKGKKREITIVLGAFTNSIFQGKKSTDESSEMNKLYIQTVETPEDSSNIEASLKTDLIAVDDLLKKIDEKLKYPQLINNEDLNLIKQIIDNLNQRKILYKNR